VLVPGWPETWHPDRRIDNAPPVAPHGTEGSRTGLRVLGIDDWEWHNRHRYGTILCYLEQGKINDLLPDRSKKRTEQWIRSHPGTEIVKLVERNPGTCVSPNGACILLEIPYLK
jgi:hypothetical protein